MQETKVQGKIPLKQGSECPRGRRIKHESRLAIGEMRQRRPARKNNAVLPLRENFEPRVKMKLDIVSRRNAKKKKGISTAKAAAAMASNGAHSSEGGRPEVPGCFSEKCSAALVVPRLFPSPGSLNASGRKLVYIQPEIDECDSRRQLIAPAHNDRARGSGIGD